MTAIPDPVRANDVRVTLPVPDTKRAGELYDLLLGAQSADEWRGRNAAIQVAAEPAPLMIDFAVADLAAAVELAGRRGLETSSVIDGRAEIRGRAPLGLTDRPVGCGEADGAVMLDHIVLTVADGEAAIALFGGRLGLDLRLVRDVGKGVSQLFFRTGSVVVEIVAGAPDSTGSIGLMGLAWRTADIDAEQRRLVDAGLDVSEVRTGRKRGTRVCTVREPALGTGTLLIEQGPAATAAGSSPHASYTAVRRQDAAAPRCRER